MQLRWNRRWIPAIENRWRKRDERAWVEVMAWVKDEGPSDDAPRVEEVRLQGNSATCNHGRRHTWRTEIMLCSRPSFIRRGPPFPIIIRRCHTSDVLCLPASSVLHVCQLVDDRARFGVQHSNQVKLSAWKPIAPNAITPTTLCNFVSCHRVQLCYFP